MFLAFQNLKEELNLKHAVHQHTELEKEKMAKIISHVPWPVNAFISLPKWTLKALSRQPPAERRVTTIK